MERSEEQELTLVRKEPGEPGAAGEGRGEETVSEETAPERDEIPDGAVPAKEETESEETAPEEAPPESSLRKEIEALRTMFEKKLLLDGYKDRLISNMSDELKAYKDGMYEKIFRPVLTDVIEIVNDLHRMIRSYSGKEEETVDKKKFLSILSIYESDLEDILEKYGVEIYTAEGKEFDAKRQKVVKVIDTGDESLHRVVAERLQKGFELDGRLLTPEKVNVYRYTESGGN